MKYKCKSIFKKMYTFVKVFMLQVYVYTGCRVGGGIAPMGGAKRAPLILANIELCGSIWRSNDSLQHTKDLSTDEDVLI